MPVPMIIVVKLNVFIENVRKKRITRRIKIKEEYFMFIKNGFVNVVDGKWKGLFDMFNREEGK